MGDMRPGMWKLMTGYATSRTELTLLKVKQELNFRFDLYYNFILI
jgi:hypothetical protein